MSSPVRHLGRSASTSSLDDVRILFLCHRTMVWTKKGASWSDEVGCCRLNGSLPQLLLAVADNDLRRLARPVAAVIGLAVPGPVAPALDRRLSCSCSSSA